MDNERFDHITRVLGDRVTRRRALGVFAGLAAVGLGDAAAKRRRRTRQRQGVVKRQGGEKGKPNQIPVADEWDETSCGPEIPVVHIVVTGGFIEHQTGRGSFTTWGGVKWTATNPENGVSVTFSASGPEFNRDNPDGTTSHIGTGPWAYNQFLPETGEPGIWLRTGRFVDVTDADGNVTSTYVGINKDICALLV